MRWLERHAWWGLAIISALIAIFGVVGAAVFYVVAGLAPGQPPPPPMISGPILALLAAVLLLVSARPFFRPSGQARA